MAEVESGALVMASFFEHLKTLPWCKQGDEVLVAVSKCTPEVIEAFHDHELKVFPGGMTVKMQKSMLHHLTDSFYDGMPLPAVLVWKRQGVEIWFRRHKAEEFPYDVWQNPAAAAYEREQVFIPASDLGPQAGATQKDLAAKAKACPSMIPPM